MTTLAVINYGVGNLFSIKQAFSKLGVAVDLVNPEEISFDVYDAIVLPGVGAFNPAMNRLESIRDTLNLSIEEGKPILGICLGLQLLFTRSYEGQKRAGLNFIDGEVTKLSTDEKLPHIGWNTITINKLSPLLDGIENNTYFYFVHSFISKPKEMGIVDATTTYGEKFPAIISKGAIFATQFHPEKSSLNGLKMLENFVNVIRS
ncbi:MAG: imidazole glycerol phosphate synthase subunit HisH [Candidatus Heimdallarchaeota archaeon]|nr:imidazole glycerol phosphate synthase subunit HisH [Candidatus Heimdallarchaeota archaeon]